jgi:SAM-dependent methyltransferase
MNTRLTPEELWPAKTPNYVINRFKGTVKFVIPRGRIIDCGENNPMKQMLEEYFEIPILSIDSDFDHPFYIDDKFDTILCLELLEHLFNPLLFLIYLKRSLSSNGRIYLSTPYQFPQFLKAKHHFHEIPTDRLMWLFDAAGLSVVRSGKITIAGRWYNHLMGFRQILRYFQYTRIYELKVKTNE